MLVSTAREGRAGTERGLPSRVPAVSLRLKRRDLRGEWSRSGADRPTAFQPEAAARLMDRDGRLARKQSFTGRSALDRHRHNPAAALGGIPRLGEGGDWGLRPVVRSSAPRFTMTARLAVLNEEADVRKGAPQQGGAGSDLTRAGNRQSADAGGHCPP